MSASPDNHRRIGAAMIVLAMAAPVSALYANDFPVFENQDPGGRDIWLDSCQGCHADGTADAPMPKDTANWQPRIEQGRDVLYSHAIEGFFGPDYAMMPPRGGNPALTDEQVRAAVDYMLQLVQWFGDQKPM